MKTIKQLINFILFSNIYVALGAFFLCISSAIELNLNNNYSYTVLCFFSTLFIYNTQRIFYKKNDYTIPQSIRRKWISENRFIVLLLITLSFIGIIVSLFFVSKLIFIYFIPVFLLSVAYFFPTIELRKNAFLKQLILVFVWTVTTAVFPMILYKTSHIKEIDLLFFISRFCFMAAICLPFDIRDLTIDATDKTLTIPQLIGERKTKIIAGIFALIYLTIELILYQNEFISFSTCSIHFITALIVLGLLLLKSKNEYVYTLGLDGTMILNGLLLFLFN
ncbi:MAG: hypothetical protein JNL69_01595 [Bacteroidia bacterium]|nr:hypothetical protein [Bacteroidia bacterium]